MNENVVIFPHNKRAYEKVCAAFETSNRTCVIQPTGTGKMYVAMQLMDDHPREEILYLTSYSPILTALNTEMKKCGVPSEHLSAALYAGLDAKVCSKQYAYIIMDEFHRVGAENWGTWASTLLENNPQSKVLGLSATPIRYLDNNRDMSDELFDGNVASSMTLAEAVGTGILKMPKYVCAVYSLADELERYKERVGKMKTDANKTEALALLEKARRSLEQAEGLPEIFAQHMTVKDGRYVVFCRNYEHMESMEEECREWFKDANSEITMYELRANRSDAVNEETLLEFSSDTSNKLKLLFVVNMLNEGVHLKNVDGCIMLRPTESMNVFLQQLGRAISVGNAERTIIFDIVNNSAQLNAFGSFKSDVERTAAETGTGVQLDDFEVHEKLRDFWDIVSQIDILLTNKSWNEWYALAEEYHRINGHLKIPKGYTTPTGEKLGQWLQRQRAIFKNGMMSVERQQKLESIGMVWEFNFLTWDEWFAFAEEYYHFYRHLKIPPNYTIPSGQSLLVWIRRQRIDYQNGLLSLEQQKKLESIGMVWDPVGELWNHMFLVATAHHDKYGDISVAQDFIASTGEKLGNWIGVQRRVYKAGEMPAVRQKKLESLGIVWSPSKAHWDEMLSYARDFRDKMGHLMIPAGHLVTNGSDLGCWIQRQRQKFRDGTLSDARTAKLNELGMVWDPYGETWDIMFELAKEYQKEYKNLDVPCSFRTENGDCLGEWISGQKKAYKSKKLSPQRQAKLESIGIAWDQKEAEWLRMYGVASEYAKKENHLRVPLRYQTPSGDNLGTWISSQRIKYKKGKLSVQRITKLESIGMVWDAKI